MSLWPPNYWHSSQKAVRFCFGWTKQHQKFGFKEKSSSLRPRVKSTGPGNIVCRREGAGEGNVLRLGGEAFIKLILVAYTTSMKNGISQASPAYVPSSWEIFLSMFTVVARAAPVLCPGPVKVCGETSFQPYLTHLYVKEEVAVAATALPDHAPLASMARGIWVALWRGICNATNSYT